MSTIEIQPSDGSGNTTVQVPLEDHRLETSTGRTVALQRQGGTTSNLTVWEHQLQTDVQLRTITKDGVDVPVWQWSAGVVDLYPIYETGVYETGVYLEAAP